MGIDYHGAKRYGRNLSSMGNEVGRISTNARTLTDNIPAGYDGIDARIYLNAVEQLRNELKSISNELDNVGEDIIDVAEEIRNEEEDDD